VQAIDAGEARNELRHFVSYRPLLRRHILAVISHWRHKRNAAASGTWAERGDTTICSECSSFGMMGLLAGGAIFGRKIQLPRHISAVAQQQVQRAA
jgi:hypothetical protein